MGSTALVVFLLGFGALAAGILIGRYYVPDDRVLKRTARHSRSYMRVINYLLARDRDAAVDELRRVVEENVADIEPYFALGALFRNRGEWERAIRVHQAIDLREGASKRIRLRARFELGLDFRVAGMPRRATRAMEDCIGQDARHEGALRSLCGLYEEQGRYAEAADAWKRLHKLQGEQRPSREHHLLVAAAQRAIETSDVDSARRLLKEAEKLDPRSPHVLAASAELAASKGNPKGASARLHQALEVAPDLAAFLVPGLIEAERQQAAVVIAKRRKKAGDEGPAEDADDPEEDELTAERAVEVLERVLESVGPNPHLLMQTADLRAQFDAPGALALYRQIGESFPDVLSARVAAARLALSGDDEAGLRRELDALAGDDGALVWAREGTWRCGHCGHRDESFFWRCHECRRWGSAHLDVGRAALEAAPPPPRERRELSRPATQSLLTSARALPELGLDSGLSASELRRAGARESVLGRVGSWLRRGKAKPSVDDERDVPPKLIE